MVGMLLNASEPLQKENDKVGSLNSPSKSYSETQRVSRITVKQCLISSSSQTYLLQIKQNIVHVAELRQLNSILLSLSGD